MCSKHPVTLHCGKQVLAERLSGCWAGLPLQQQGCMAGTATHLFLLAPLHPHLTAPALPSPPSAPGPPCWPRPLQDPFNEDDWDSYTAFTEKGLAQIVGDDLLCTNPKRVQKAIDTKACNALLLKVGAGVGWQAGGWVLGVGAERGWVDGWASRRGWRMGAGCGMRDAGSFGCGLSGFVWEVF